MQQDVIWDYFQGEGVESFEGNLSRLAYLVRRVRRGERLLNIGVGNGRLEELALARGIDVYALDPSQAAIERLRARLGLGDRARVGRGESLPFADGFFDAATLSEVLEHLAPEAYAKTLSEVSRVLKPGGRALGTVPARENLPASLVVCPACACRFHRWGHVRSFTRASLDRDLRQWFASVATRERRFVAWNQVDWMGRIRGAIRAALNLCGVHNLGENIFFEARKTRGG